MQQTQLEVARHRLSSSTASPAVGGGLLADDGSTFAGPKESFDSLTSKASSQKLEDEECPSSRQLWVGNVPQDTPEVVLMEFFTKYGSIDNISVYPQRNYAFVKFKSLEDAKAAKTELQGKTLAGSALRIEFAKPAKPCKHLWIGGVSNLVSKEQLEAELKKYGMLREFKMLRDRNYALAEYEKLEDAIAAVEKLNRKRIGNEELRVDYLRSQPMKREISAGPYSSPADLKLAGPKDHFAMGFLNSVRGSRDDLRSPQSMQTRYQAGVATDLNARHSGEEPSKVLWIGYPSSLRLDEERLRRAFILFGEVEQIKMVPGHNFCFVQFRNVDEARCAKEGLQGRLFNDPRVQIRFSNSLLGRTMKDDESLLPLHTRQDGLLQPEWMGPKTSLSSIERFDHISPRKVNHASTLRPGLQHEFKPGGSVPGFGRELAGGTAVGLGGPVHRVVGPSHDIRIPFDGPDMHPNGRGQGGPASFGLAPMFGHFGRSSLDSWNNPDEDLLVREFKRPKVRATFNSLKDGQLSGSGSVAGSDRVPLEGFQPGFSNERNDQRQNVLHEIGDQRQNLDSKFQFTTLSDGLQLRPFGLGPGVLGPVPSSRIVGNSHDYRLTNAEWKWKGVIAKAGTVVCRVLSFPIGNGIDVSLPDVVNCFARTDLDMLAKHFYQAAGFGAIYFAPDGDHEIQCYQEFLRYLGDKHRAGVAKLNDGVTLFLVPPSEFSEKVLKLHGDCLFGVVLKSPQIGNHASLHQHMQFPFQEQQEQQNRHPHMHSQLKPSANGALTPPVFLKDEPLGSLKSPHVSQASHVPVMLSQPTLGQSANLPLTPELIASLTAILPLHGQSGTGGVSGSNTIGDVAGVTTEVKKPFQIGSFNPSISRELPSEDFLRQPQPTLQHAAISHLNGTVSTDTQNQTLAGFGGFNPLPQQSIRSLGEVPQPPAQDLNHLVTLLTRQQRPPVQHAAQVGQHQASAGIQSAPPFRMLPLVNQSQGAQLEPPPHLQQEGFSHSGFGAQSGVSIGLQGGWSSLPQQDGGVAKDQGSTDPETEKHNRFQATLQLAAALLQSMHQSGKQQDGTSHQ